MPARKAKKRGTKKATKTNLEAKIAKLQAKLNALSAQAAKSAKARAQPPKIYTGENYYRTRQRLAYHPSDKQFRGGQVARTVQVSSPPKPAPEHVLEPQQEPKKEKPKRTEEVPAPKVKYTGENYYRTRQRLAYHPSDKQFTGG